MKRFVLIVCALLTGCAPSKAELHQTTQDEFQELQKICRTSYPQWLPYTECVATRYNATLKESHIHASRSIALWKAQQNEAALKLARGEFSAEAAQRAATEADTALLSSIESKKAKYHTQKEALIVPAMLVVGALVYMNAEECRDNPGSCERQKAQEEYYDCLKVHDRYECAYLEDKAGIP